MSPLPAPAMICPDCDAEYVPGVMVCSDCHVDLVGPRAPTVHLDRPDGLTEVWSSSTPWMISALADVLDRARIPHHVGGDAEASAFDGFQILRVFVQPEDARRAERLIRVCDEEPRARASRIVALEADRPDVSDVEPDFDVPDVVPPPELRAERARLGSLATVCSLGLFVALACTPQYSWAWAVVLVFGAEILRHWRRSTSLKRAWESTQQMS